MTRRLLIASSSNRRLKALRRLERRPSRNGVIVVEGHRQVRAALDAGVAIHELYAAPELFLGPEDARLVARAARAGARVYELTPAAFTSVAREARPDGLVAVVARPSAELAALRLPPCPLVVVTDAVERPGNLGTIVRTATAAAADAIVVGDGVTDPFHPASLRAAVGTLFRIPLAAAPSDVAIDWLRERGLRIVAASPDAERPYWETDFCLPTAVVVGSERHGVGAAWRGAADELVAIPMPGPADSLNVGVAAGIVLFEAGRQRRAGG
jgi:TrmH family RNA methyltransferase